MKKEVRANGAAPVKVRISLCESLSQNRRGTQRPSRSKSTDGDRDRSPLAPGCDEGLADFIRDYHEAILCEWEAFARTLGPGAQGMSKAGLRDHGDEILTAIVHDMESLQADARGRGDAPHRLRPLRLDLRDRGDGRRVRLFDVLPLGRGRDHDVKVCVVDAKARTAGALQAMLLA